MSKYNVNEEWIKTQVKAIKVANAHNIFSAEAVVIGGVKAAFFALHEAGLKPISTTQGITNIIATAVSTTLEQYELHGDRFSSESVKEWGNTLRQIKQNVVSETMLTARQESGVDLISVTESASATSTPDESFAAAHYSAAAPEPEPAVELVAQPAPFDDAPALD